MGFFPERKALEILGGEQIEQLGPEDKLVKYMSEGGGLWNVDDKEKWSGIFNHVMLEYNAGIHLAKKLKKIGEEQDINELADIDIKEAGMAALLHDIGKRRAEESIEQKKTHKDEHAKIGQEMLTAAGFSENISHAAGSHYFPTSIDQLPTIYDKLVLFTDLIASQKYTTPEERLNDIERRWIIDRKANGQEPLIDERIFEKFKEVSLKVAKEIFDLMGEDPQKFVENIPRTREERVLRVYFERNLEERGIKFAGFLDKIREGKEKKRNDPSF